VHLWSPVQGLIDARSEYDHLPAIFVPIVIGAFTVMVLVAFAAVVISRRRPAGRPPPRWQERSPLQGSYAVLLACAAALLLYLAFTTEHNINTVADQHHPSVVIKVLAAPRRASKPTPKRRSRQPLTVRGIRSPSRTMIRTSSEPSTRSAVSSSASSPT
jgi:hypothetical protein